MIDIWIPKKIKDKKCSLLCFVYSYLYSLHYVNWNMYLPIWYTNLCIWLLCNQKLQIYNLLFSRVKDLDLIYNEEFWNHGKGHRQHYNHCCQAIWKSWMDQVVCFGNVLRNHCLLLHPKHTSLEGNVKEIDCNFI